MKYKVTISGADKFTGPLPTFKETDADSPEAALKAISPDFDSVEHGFLHTQQSALVSWVDAGRTRALRRSPLMPWQEVL